MNLYNLFFWSERNCIRTCFIRNNILSQRQQFFFSLFTLQFSYLMLSICTINSLFNSLSRTSCDLTCNWLCLTIPFNRFDSFLLLGSCSILTRLLCLSILLTKYQLSILLLKSIYLGLIRIISFIDQLLFKLFNLIIQ